jgi:hypothetical protein
MMRIHYPWLSSEAHDRGFIKYDKCTTIFFASESRALERIRICPEIALPEKSRD